VAGGRTAGLSIRRTRREINTFGGDNVILLTLAVALAMALLQDDIGSSPLIVAILALLALPGVTSLVTSVIRKASDALGIEPPVIVYVASLIVTGLLIATGSVTLPGWTGDPAAYIMAWLAWATVNAELARRVYELLLSKLFPSPAGAR